MFPDALVDTLGLMIYLYCPCVDIHSVDERYVSAPFRLDNAKLNGLSTVSVRLMVGTSFQRALGNTVSTQA